MKRLSLILFLIISITSKAFPEQKIFISQTLQGDDLYKSLVKWAKETSERDIIKKYKFNTPLKTYENGIIELFYVSSKIKDDNILCFDVILRVEYDKFIADFSNVRLFNIKSKNIKKIYFNIWYTLTNSGWFREYNYELDSIVESLEKIID